MYDVKHPSEICLVIGVLDGDTLKVRCGAEDNYRQRQPIWQPRSRPLLDALHRWMLVTRQKITGGAATANSLDYSPKR